MTDQILDEWQELTEDFKKLENINKIYQDKLEEVIKYQKECEKQIQHQTYRITIISKSIEKSPSDKYQNIKEEITKRQAQLHDIRQTLPRDSGSYLKVILGNVNVSILNKEEKLKYKSEYEKFKLVISVVAFILALVNIAFISRRVERFYMFLLVWYYFTLTIRETILKVNGSRIKGWWRAHHFISAGTAAILLIWPQNESWNQFRITFMVFNAYLSFVQFLQFRYQRGVLYRLKALGERDNMDITVEGFHRWMWRGLSFLFPFLFVVYFFQLYIAFFLYNLSHLEGVTWHVLTLSIMFFILSIGNITTMIIIIPDKIKNSMKSSYKIFSQKLFYREDFDKEN